MSHFTKVGTKITDMDILKSALNQMGLHLENSGMCRMYYGSTAQENIVKLPGKYDMYFQKSDTGAYDIVADFWGGDVSKTIGENGAILMRSYAVEKLKIEVRKKGYSFYKLSEDRFRIEDPTDSSPGYLEARLDENGNFIFKANGFSGASCTKFNSLEEALGEHSREFTPEYYMPESGTERIHQNEEEW